MRRFCDPNEGWIFQTCFVAIVFASLFLYLVRLYNSSDAYRDQLLRAGEAFELVREIDDQLASRPDVPALGFYRAGKIFSERHPDVSAYILDSSGRIIYSLSAMTAPESQTVSTKPIEKLLQDRNLTAGPIYGDNPERPDTGEVFSAAPLSIGLGGQNFEGYVYVVLHNRIRRLAMLPWFDHGLIIGASIYFIVGVSFLILVKFLRKRTSRQTLHRISHLLDTFPPGFSDKIEPPFERSDLESYERGIVDLVTAVVKDRASLQGREKEVQQMISRVSHDLKTPLFLIQEYAERLMSDGLELDPDEQRLEATRIRRNVKSLVALLSDLDQFDRLKGSSPSIEREAFQIEELAHDLVSMYKIHTDAAGIQLRVASSNGPSLVFANIALIERAVRNLLDNAIRHSSAGGSVELRLTAHEQGVRVEVADTGCGIPSDELPHIFDPFRQVDRPGRDNGNSGLGLAIVDQVIRAHGGKISVESELQAGTRFWFELPAAGAENTRGAESSADDKS